ncbi:hypothetical protein TruAng_007344 [Truncatella angustata]|nr:hypothetical protein TruAng_007344 [Truncatella angustata]
MLSHQILSRTGNDAAWRARLSTVLVMSHGANWLNSSNCKLLDSESTRPKADVTHARIQDDKSSLPPPAATSEEDEDLFGEQVWCDAPIKMDYGRNVNNSTWIDTCLITVGSRTLIGPNCSFYSGTHPIDPTIRNGTKGPESGKPITIGEDCWFGGNATVLPGVTIGKGSVIGAGSVVTKDVPEYSVVAGNPARKIRSIVPSPTQAPVGVVGTETVTPQKQMDASFIDHLEW